MTEASFAAHTLETLASEHRAEDVSLLGFGDLPTELVESAVAAGYPNGLVLRGAFDTQGEAKEVAQQLAEEIIREKNKNQEYQQA
jgi:hypothetical protein